MKIGEKTYKVTAVGDEFVNNNLVLILCRYAPVGAGGRFSAALDSRML